GLALRRDQNAGRELYGLGDRRQKAERHEGLVEGRLLVVERNPAIPRRRAEDVIGDLDIGVAEIFRRLRPVADLRGVVADIERREEGVELHGGPPTGSGRSLSGALLRRCMLNSYIAFAGGWDAGANADREPGAVITHGPFFPGAAEMSARPWGAPSQAMPPEVKVDLARLAPCGVAYHEITRDRKIVRRAKETVTQWNFRHRQARE